MKAHSLLPNVTARSGGDFRRDAPAGMGHRAVAARMIAVPALVLFGLFLVSFFAATAAPAAGHPGATAWMLTALAHHCAG
jgi:hypothetical protein